MAFWARFWIMSLPPLLRLPTRRRATLTLRPRPNQAPLPMSGGRDAGRMPMPRRSCRAADQVGGLLADHDAGRIGIAGGHRREDRGIGDAQSLEPVHPQALVDHGVGTRRPHAAGADRVIGGLRVGADPAEDLLVALDAR